MQAIREKISDIRGTRKVKSDAIQDEQAELARAQEVAHEERLIRQAEVAMGMRAEEYIQYGAKLTGDHKNTTGYGGSGLNNRAGGSPRTPTRYSGGTYSPTGGTLSPTGEHESRKMAIHHKYL